jgi:hypothetical protein
MQQASCSSRGLLAAGCACGGPPACTSWQHPRRQRLMAKAAHCDMSHTASHEHQPQQRDVRGPAITVLPCAACSTALHATARMMIGSHITCLATLR